MGLEAGYLHDETEIREKSSRLASKIIDRQLCRLTGRKSKHISVSGSRVKESVVFIDTCAILEFPASRIYFQNAALRENRDKEKIIVPLSVMGELQSLASKKDDMGIYQTARTMWAMIMECWKRGLVNIYDARENAIFADEIFQSLVLAFARDYDVTVISQDYWLSQDILTLCRLPSVRGRKVNVRKLDSKGNLVPVEWRGAFYLTFIGE